MTSYRGMRYIRHGEPLLRWVWFRAHKHLASIRNLHQCSDVCHWRPDMLSLVLELLELWSSEFWSCNIIVFLGGEYRSLSWRIVEKKFPWSMIEAKEVGLQIDCILVALNKQRSSPSPWLLLVFNYSILLGRRGYISSLQFLSLSHGTCLFFF